MSACYNIQEFHELRGTKYMDSMSSLHLSPSHPLHDMYSTDTLKAETFPNHSTKKTEKIVVLRRQAIGPSSSFPPVCQYQTSSKQRCSVHRANMKDTKRTEEWSHRILRNTFAAQPSTRLSTKQNIETIVTDYCILSRLWLPALAKSACRITVRLACKTNNTTLETGVTAYICLCAREN